MLPADDELNTRVAHRGDELGQVARQPPCPHAHRAAGRGADRVRGGPPVLELGAGAAVAALRVAQHDRPLVTPRVAMQVARDLHEAAITTEHERGSVGSGDLDRLERVLDGLGAHWREPDEASDEAAQR